MADEEIAPPTESWPEHLKALDNQQIAALAKDYRWLDEEAQPADSRSEFRQRREAILAECQRRGMTEAAEGCRRPA